MRSPRKVSRSELTNALVERVMASRVGPDYPDFVKEVEDLVRRGAPHDVLHWDTAAQLGWVLDNCTPAQVAQVTGRSLG